MSPAAEGAVAPGLGRRERRKRETRRALLEAGLALIGTRGVYDTRIEDVTERADVGKGAFYNYFDSKAALVAALVVDAVQALEGGYLRRQAPSRHFAGRLAAAVQAHEDFFRESPARAILFHQARGLLELSHEPSTELRAAFTDYLERLGRYLHPEHVGRAALLENAALVAGAIAGHRSFARAGGIPARGRRLVEALRSGVRDLGARRPAATPPSSTR